MCARPTSGCEMTHPRGAGGASPARGHHQRTGDAGSAAVLGRRGAIALLGAALLPKSHAAVTWRLATGYRADSFQTLNIEELAGDVSRATSGSLNIHVHPGASLLKLDQIQGAVEAGKLDAGETIMTGMAGSIPIAGADAVPFIVRSYQDARRMWRHQRPLMERQFQSRGLYLLYAVPWPPQGLYTTKPIASTRDFIGARMRTYNPTTARIAALLGAQGVDVPMMEVARALSEGRIDCMITSGITGVENKVWSTLKYYYEINAWFPKNIVFANAKAVEALSDAERRALEAAAGRAETRGWLASEEAATKATDELRRNGIKVDRIPAGFASDLKRLGEQFSLEWLRQVGREANDIFVPYFTQA